MKEYFKQIDALRCYAVFSVIFGHLYVLPLGEHNFFTVFYKYVPGVQLFFCISGFLITGILIHQSEKAKKTTLLKSFYIRRFLRIFPIYYATIFVLFIANIEGYRDWFIYDLFYVSNIKMASLGEFGDTIAPHFWSLAVEEQFYLMWPGLLLLLPRKHLFYGLSILLLCVGIVSTVVSDHSFAMARTLTSLTYLGSGALLAVMYKYSRERFFDWKKAMDIAIVVFLGFIVLLSTGVNLDLPKSAEFLIGALIIPLLVIRFSMGFEANWLKQVFENRIIVYMGRISYGLYVYHLLALYPAVLIKKTLHLSFLDEPAAMMVFKILLTVGISIVSWEFFEKRLNGLKSRFKYS